MAKNWNPWHGCKKYSEGCKYCYVYRGDQRRGKDASVITKTTSFDMPIAKDRHGAYKIPEGELVWTCFTSDFFLEDADIWRPEAWRMMKERQDLSFFFITKRIQRFYDVIPDDWGDGYPNVAMGCTMENQWRVEERMPLFREVPVQSKTIICEPLLDEIDLRPYLGHWVHKVVAGGESGTEARICYYEWILKIRDACADFDIPFWFKQTGANFAKDGKVYRIPRKLQHIQARKAGINSGNHSLKEI